MNTLGSMHVYGHFGVPVLFFPAEGGNANDLEDKGLIHTLAEPIEAGAIKLYTVDANDHATFSNTSLPTEERARRYRTYTDWIDHEVAEAIATDCGGQVGIATAGVSMGAYHAVHAALRRADLFPYAIGMSGNYDPTNWKGWGDLGEATYYANPFAYVNGMDGDHLQWLRQHVFIQLVVGSGMWEDTTGALQSSHALEDLLTRKGIPNALDVWGSDTPHDWPSWHRMALKHLSALGG